MAGAGEFFFEFAGQLVHIRGLAESLDLLDGGLHVDAGMLTKFLQHLLVIEPTLPATTFTLFSAS